MNTLTGRNLIGLNYSSNDRTFFAVNPKTNENLKPAFSVAQEKDVAAACGFAEAAFDAFRYASLEKRAAFLNAIGAEIMELGDALIERAMLETALPRPRLEGERARTVGQLEMFARLLSKDDGWRDERFEPALPDRTPLPRPELRLRKIPLGPVVVFGASNFPLAFSTAGGDTASALAAGCPVIVKGHPSPPRNGRTCRARHTRRC